MKIQITQSLRTKHLVVFATIVCVQLLGSSATSVTYVGLAIWAFRGPRETIEALTLSWLLAFLTPAFFQVGAVSPALRWAILFAGFIQLLLRAYTGKLKLPRPIFSLLFFVLFCGATSFLVSYSPVVSLLKLLIFFVGCFTVLTAFDASNVPVNYWQTWFVSLFLFLLIGSLPLFFHRYGFLRNAQGFQGLLNHPQSYALFISIMLAYLAGKFLFERDPSYTVLISVSIGLFSLFATRARTGIITFVGSLFIASVMAVFFNRRWRPAMTIILHKPIYLLVLCLPVLLAAYNLDTVSDEARSFLHKNQTDQTIGESFQGSRGLLILRSWQNFGKSPWIGNGFGVASDPYMFQIEKDSVFGIPISASIEKGFLPTAILEETGILGSLLLLFFLWNLARPIFKIGSLPDSCLFLACLSVNIGENIFFSFGGMGLFMWLMIGLARRMRK